jgi:hypothetical protein
MWQRTARHIWSWYDSCQEVAPYLSVGEALVIAGRLAALVRNFRGT